MISFSVITPYYKGEKYLPALIHMAEKNLIALQNAKIEAMVELIIVNDSPKETVLVPEYSDKIQVQVINHKDNSGIHQARVTGLQNCRGEYVIFLDQDDEIADSFLHKQYIKVNDADVVVSNAYLQQKDFSMSLHFKGKGQFKNAFEIGPYIKAHNQIISPGQCLIRKAAIPDEWKRYIIRTNGSDDLFLWVLMLLRKNSFIMNEEILYTHKFTGSNLSAEEKKMAQSSIEAANFMKKIDYVPQKMISMFMRNREMKINTRAGNNISNILLAICNADLMLPRIWWKMRTCMGKYN